MIAAIAFVALLGLLCLFQLALAFGAPWGRLAWGGQNAGTLPRGYRVASAASIVIYALLGLIALDRAGLVDVVPDWLSTIAMWVVFGYLTLGVLMNAISRSKPERFVMTPVSLVLAVLALIIALAGPIERTFDGMILDTGDGPLFCTIIMESYPPQCGDPVAVDGWDWSVTEYEESQSIRWGDYQFRGIKNGDTITVAGLTPRS